MKIKKPQDLFIVKDIFLIKKNECKTPYGCLTFIFYQKYFFMIKWPQGFFIFL